MSKAIAIIGLVSQLVLIPAAPLAAAELNLQPSVNSGHRSRCGPCGCLHTVYVYHPELKSTYGLDFDPRNYDQTEPHYYLGRVRGYPHYYVEGYPGLGPSC